MVISFNFSKLLRICIAKSAKGAASRLVRTIAGHNRNMLHPWLNKYNYYNNLKCLIRSRKKKSGAGQSTQRKKTPIDERISSSHPKRQDRL